VAIIFLYQHYEKCYNHYRIAIGVDYQREITTQIMQFLTSLLITRPYIDLPYNWLNWLSIILLFGTITYLNYHWRFYNKTWNNKRWVFLGILTIAVPITSLYFGIQFSAHAIPRTNIPEEPIIPIVMLFSFLPWVLASGLLGPLPATGLALFSGLFLALYQTHNPFTPLLLALIAVFYSNTVMQRYRTKFFKYLRHPFLAALLTVIIYAILFILIMPFSFSGSFAQRLDLTLTLSFGSWYTFTIGMLIAAGIAELIAKYSDEWGRLTPLIPSPGERSLHTRMVYFMLLLTSILTIVLIGASWYVSNKTAKNMLRVSLQNPASIAADSTIYVIQTGQSIITIISEDPRLLETTSDSLLDILSEDIKIGSFFTQLIVYDSTNKVIAAYPNYEMTGAQQPVEELIGIHNAFEGIPIQHFTIQPSDKMLTAQISFIATIENEDGTIQRILIGRSYLGQNPVANPIIKSLNSMKQLGGGGKLIDSKGHIIIDTDIKQVWETYTPPNIANHFYEETNPTGLRQFAYIMPVKGYDWQVVTSVPTHMIRKLALEIALPMTVLILILSAIAVALLTYGVKEVVRLLQNLAVDANNIAKGNLEHPIDTSGIDELAKLRRAFDKMRVSLATHLEDLRQLLIVSQGVASHLEIPESIEPILDAALRNEASSARIILTDSTLPELFSDDDKPLSFGKGGQKDNFQHLDSQILDLCKEHERWVIPNTKRPQLLKFTDNNDYPASLVAVALHQENVFFGAFWVAYEYPYIFTEEEVNFITTLGSHASMAIANARLFQSTEISRQRLAAILSSTPDPVLVIDQRNRLLLTNPAAWQMLGMNPNLKQGDPIEEVVKQPELVELLKSSWQEDQSEEITLTNGRIYLATATSVISEGQRVGRVCVLQDITYFKELDAMKSEFVSTVSHDLRSPLTLMRGYATMLEMVGQLNEQQSSYVNKIVAGIESITHLVNNLLDLGRIEAGVGLQLELLKPESVLDHVVSALRLQATQKRIELTTDLPETEIPEIEADRALLQQALHNIIENAIKFTRPEGNVIAHISVQSESIIYKVQDNGVGISPMDIQQLFEKFHRIATIHQGENRGSGLGLAIVKSIVERHHGKVWVESRLGQGSTFYIEIPIKQPIHE